MQDSNLKPQLGGMQENSHYPALTVCPMFLVTVKKHNNFCIPISVPVYNLTELT